MTTTLNASTAGAGGFIATGDNSGSLALQTAGTTAVTIDTSQNVGIGTSSPSYKLTVSGASVGRGFALSDSTTGSISGQVNNNTNQFNFGVNNSVGNGMNGGGAYGVSLESNGAYPMAFVTNATERMRIDSNGRVGINGSALDSSWLSITGNVSNPTLESYQNTTSLCSHLWFRNPNGIVGSITLSGSSTAYNTSSDYRLKENIAPMTGALAKVAQLKPVTFKWKVDGSDCEGFIAHELQEVKPDCVSGAKDAVDEHGNPVYQGIDTSFLVATLTAAIQELSAKNDALTARVVALESK
jgi:Chaperone of endosialidase